MHSGLVIYAIDLSTMVEFYTNVFQLSVRESDADYTALVSGDFELVLLQAPEVVTQQVTISKPPIARRATPIKPVFYLDQSLSDVRQITIDQGGQFNDAEAEWQFNGHTVCDGTDIEGNIFQVRTPHS